MKKFTIHLCLLLFITPFLGAQNATINPINRDLSTVEQKRMVQLDNQGLYDEEMKNREAGELPHFAHKLMVDWNSDEDGTWIYTQGNLAVWRLRITSKEAKSLNFGFRKFRLPTNANLILYTTDFKDLVGPLTSADNKEHERLWTPIVLGDDVVIEAQIPQDEVDEFALEISEVNHDFMGINSLMTTSACHIDVNCGMANGHPEVEDFRDQIQAVAMYTLNGDRTCSGALINNTNQDCRPFFLTANHCDIDTENAATIVAYWNYQNSSCRDLGSDASGADGDGQLSVFSMGASLRASTPKTDVALIEFDNAIPNNANAYFVGWDLTETMATKVIGIHHPQSMEKRISFENDPVFQGDNNGDADENGNYIIVPDWDSGVTEVGSSGSPLFNQDGYVIGQLFGGLVYDDVNCGASEQTDFYGWINKSWEGSGSMDTRLRDWLDPQGTGATLLDGKYQEGCQALAITDTYQSVCALDNNQISFDLTAGSGGAVNLSVIEKPGAMTASFASSSLQANQSTTLTLGNLSALATDDYTITVQASFGGATSEFTLFLELLQNVPELVNIVEPTDGADDATLTQPLTWAAVTNAIGYEVQLATDASFENILAEASDFVGTTFLPGIVLEQGTLHYWRVRGKNACGTGDWSTPASFTTLDNDFQGCITLNAIDLPINIDAADSGDYPSTINFPFGDDMEVVEKIRVVDIKGAHSWIGDLTMQLESPKGTKITLIDAKCFDSPDPFAIGFDDLSPFVFNEDEDCPYSNNIIYTPQDSLANFIGENPNGDWKLTISDGVPADGGVFNGWSIEICLSTMTPTREVIPPSSIKLFPNPARNTVFLAVDHQISSQDMIVSVLNLQGSRLLTQRVNASNATELDISQMTPGMYIVQLLVEGQMVNKKLIIH